MSHAWSYSSLTSFEQCPRRYAAVRIYKTVKESQTAALMHGNEAHKAIELYGKREAAMPEKFASYAPIVDTVLKAPGVKHFEVSFALTQNLQPTTFFAKDVWARGKLDLEIVAGDKAVVLDWKAGKPKTDPTQLELFAAASMTLRPYVNTVKTGFVWLAHNLLDQTTYERGQVKTIWDSFRARAERVDHALKYEEFPPKPSGLCRGYCPVPKRLCEFSGKD